MWGYAMPSSAFDSTRADARRADSVTKRAPAIFFTTSTLTAFPRALNARVSAVGRCLFGVMMPERLLDVLEQPAPTRAFEPLPLASLREGLAGEPGAKDV